MKFIACYTNLENGYMGQLLEWPSVITCGNDLEACEYMLKDAARKMALAYYDDGQEIPQEELIVKPISIPLDDEAFMSEHNGHHDILTDGNGRYVTLKRDENFDSRVVIAICKEAGISRDFMEDEEIS